MIVLNKLNITFIQIIKYYIIYIDIYYKIQI